ncbi:6-bladed beta-propeller [Odoribacter lunatus]|uniref:6-bladed beta-propeller n=1 Tax=Odoribacter lunatus TaxID=2941335 RepID=UPI00203E00E0|nr:6-bladed beta-propeller [Odoribacter lunatus]
MKTKFVLFLLSISALWGCSQQSPTERHYKEYGKVVDVHDRVQPIEMKDVFIGDVTSLYLMDKYFIIGDYNSPDKLIHLFDKNSFKYICSTGNKGKGPGEITNLGHIAPDKVRRKFYVSDHGKLKIFSFDLDSLLANPLYRPSIKVSMNKSRFPSEYEYINDTLCFGRMIEPIGNNDFKPYVGKWNMLTNDIELMKYEHPDVKKKRTVADVSPELGLYVEVHSLYDLITVGTLDGELKYNIYGPKWETKLTKNNYYYSPLFCKDKIITTYLGEYRIVKEANGNIKVNYPTRFIVFDLEGNYLQTWETNYEISRFIYDEENNRLIMSLEYDDVQFAYLDLEGLL